MTSALNEPKGEDDRADAQGNGADDTNIEIIESGPQDSTGPVSMSGSSGGDGDDTPAAASKGETVVRLTPAPAKRDILDVGGPDSDELRRLEESIRWLMDAGSMRLPQATPLPPVFGLPSAQAPKSDSLILDPEALFTPRMPRHRSDAVREAAKILLVSAIAAPTAYFAASWMQFPGAAASSDAAAISGSAVTAGPADVRVAALEPASEAVRDNAVVKVDQPPAQVALAPPPAPVAPQQIQVVPRPADRMVDTVTAAASGQKVVPEPTPSIVATPPADPPPSARSVAEHASAPLSAASAPAKPGLRPAEIAMMIERGRTLFDAGDLVAARLFFRRAANAGDSSAAIAMGATYDPDVLAQRFIRGIEGDAQEAERWYEKARSLGGTGTRIEMLAHR
jgi:TPR repeat protein